VLWVHTLVQLKHCLVEHLVEKDLHTIVAARDCAQALNCVTNQILYLEGKK
jgi:hypothetical protein